MRGRNEWRQGRTANLTIVLLSTIVALLHHLGWNCSTVDHWGPKALNLQLVLTSASCLKLTRTPRAPSYIIFYVHLLLLFFRLFTQVHLLIGGSVEGQYITHLYDNMFNFRNYLLDGISFFFIIIIIKLLWEHGFLWLSFFLHSSL